MDEAIYIKGTKVQRYKGLYQRFDCVRTKKNR